MSQWGSCDHDCGNGHRTRTFFVTLEAKGSGSMCESQHEEEAVLVCNTEDCGMFFLYNFQQSDRFFVIKN